MSEKNNLCSPEQKCIICGNAEKPSSPKEHPEISICQNCWNHAEQQEVRFDPTPY
jgi:uncharacterized CHY-type Zn-finger protein